MRWVATRNSTSALGARCRSRSATKLPVRVEGAGPDPDTKSGAKVAVYPWIGCGQCAACKVGDENICTAPRHLGVNVGRRLRNSSVLVPHPRYLIDHAPLPAGTPAR